MTKNLATQLIEHDKNIILVYAFNGTGKTRLSVAYKDVTKERNEGNHSGVYYNAYSEDLFVWDNDEENDGANIRLLIQKSSLNQYHASLDEDKLREKLAPYKPKFEFQFNLHSNTAEGIESVRFFVKDDKTKDSEDEVLLADEEGSIIATEDGYALDLAVDNPIKISRGEEQIFLWCFFLTLFDIEGWTGEGNQSGHFFIDDPVSSLDDHNIFVTVASIMDLIERHYKNRKIIITTHHIGFFSILFDWIKKGEKADSYKNEVQGYILKKNHSVIQFVNPKNDVFLYHLELMQTLKKAIDENVLYAYHFALLRQVLENISSFLGVGRFSYVLEQIGYTDADEIAQIVNIMSHKNVFRYEAKDLVPDNERMFKDVFNRIQNKYNFVLHSK
jgi:wobble nucleotide-excising tRNase